MYRRTFNYRGILAAIGLAALLCGSSAVLAQVAPPLGQAGNFAVLAGSAITNTGPSIIVGDVGIWPGSAITGFPPGIITGTIHATDAVAQQAQSDLTTAYNNLAGQACNAVMTGTDLGGLTLTPGVYCFASSAQLTGILTLDAQGNPNAVFIFQMGSTLTTASNASVQVINGGFNCNVFWQVGSSATLGTGTAFVGNILAFSSISANTGASVVGRMLASNGASTMDTNSVSVCTAACNAITLSPATLPSGAIGIAYSQTITASGGTAPYAFTLLSGAPPAGLTLSSDGVLSGIPTSSGSFTFTVRATDSIGCFGDQIYTIVINMAACPTIMVSPVTLPAADPGIPYNQAITASGGTAPYTFAVTSGLLPPLLTLSSSGTFSGTPTTPGSYTFTVTATDSAGCLGSRVYTIVINIAACPTITVSPLTLPAANAGIPYNQTITASGGTAPYTFTVTSGSLPPALTLSTSGTLSGTPTTPGSYTFTVTATDAAGCPASQIYTLTIAANIGIVPAPTLSQWGLGLLAGLLALVGFLTVRNRGTLNSR